MSKSDGSMAGSAAGQLARDWSRRAVMPSVHLPVPPWHSCASCGYDLAGLDPRSSCPECGTPIERTLRGDLLRFDRTATIERLLVRLQWGRLALLATVLAVGLLSLGGGVRLGSHSANAGLAMLVWLGVGVGLALALRRAFGGVAGLARRTAADDLSQVSRRWAVAAPVLACGACLCVGLWTTFPGGSAGMFAGVLGLVQFAVLLGGSFNLLTDVRRAVRAELQSAMRRLTGPPAGITQPEASPGGKRDDRTV